MTFIDFKKAFDSINRDTMWRIVRHGVPEKIVNIIKYFRILGEEFLIATGILQWDTLARFSFIIVLYYVLQNTEATTGLQIHPDELLPDLNFADDIVLLDQGETEPLERFRTAE